MVDLEQCRHEIDNIDKQIADLFQARMAVSKRVAEHKIATGKKVYDKVREDEKLQKLATLASNEFNVDAIKELFAQIMSISRKYQYALMEKVSYPTNLLLTSSVSRENRHFFSPVDKLCENGKAKVVFQGTMGSYSEQAMMEFFGKDIESRHVGQFQDVMTALEHGEADFGVLPIENSSTGEITDVYDLLVGYDLRIVGEQIIQIEHALLGTRDAQLSDVSRVYSHHQGLMQCKEFLDRHQDWEQIGTRNTAVAAQKVSEDGDRTQVAIAGMQAADAYHLKVLAENIQSLENNATRFIIISKEKIYVRDADKISICFELPHESGTLYNILSHLMYNQLNMTKIESRPLKDRNWEYRFFIDVDGNLQDAGVLNAIRGIREESNHFKLLGNYKRS